MTTDPTAAAAVLPIGSALQTIPVSNTESEQFVLLRAPAMPEFCFLIRADAKPRYGWEAWLTIHNAQVDVLSAIAGRSNHYHRVRIASNTGELDALPLTAAAPAIAATCHGSDIATIFVQHAHQQWLWSDGLAIPGIRIVDLSDYPLALLARYGMEIIADALAWIDFDRSRGLPRPITTDRIHFLECHTAHLKRDLEMERRFRR